jgi:hypothetical protein
MELGAERMYDRKGCFCPRARKLEECILSYAYGVYRASMVRYMVCLRLLSSRGCMYVYVYVYVYIVR